MSTELLQVEVAPPDRGQEPADLMRMMVEKGVTSDNVAAFKELAELQWKFQERNAAKEFARAFIELQKEIPQIKATKTVPDRTGNVKFMVAPFEEIDAELRPLALKHGFTYTFTEGESQPSRVSKVCIVRHVEGHEQRNEYSVRIGSGPPGATESQADGAAHSYAKRGALCDAFSIVIDRAFETDPRNEGATITPAQAEELQHRVKMTNSNEMAFLKFCGVQQFGTPPTLDDYKKIRASGYEAGDEMLCRKEQRGK